MSGSGILACLMTDESVESTRRMDSFTAIVLPQREDLHFRTMSQTEPSNEALLFRRHLEGDDGAFIKLFHQFNHRLYLYCLKVIGDPGHAEDITQELWERVIRLREHPHPVDNPIGFFLKIAKNLCLNSIRGRKREMNVSSDPDWSTLDTSVTPSDFEEAVKIALQSLSVEDREVIVLSVYWGYSMPEIAALMNKSTESVWKRASRARQRLREDVLQLTKSHKTPK